MATLWFSGAQVASAACLYGSLTNCNPAGSTFNPAAAFVDADPPAGFVQCAGFRNTASNDVRWDWDNNCASQKDGVLFVRVFDDASGTLIAGARLFQGVGGCFPNESRTYRTDLQEGEGLLDNPGLTCGFGGSGGATLGWSVFEVSHCFCARSGEVAMCDDISAASAANDKILQVGGNSFAHQYEAVWGPPGPKGTCTQSATLTALRVAIYVPDPKCGDGVLDPGNACDDGNLFSGDGCDRDCQIELCRTCSGEPSSCTTSADGTSCDDQRFCNGPDTCSSGSCTTHSANPCLGGAECSNFCNENDDTCSVSAGTPCTDDGNICTGDECDGQGSCTHPDEFAECDDGIFCNGADFCNEGSCSSHTNNPCGGSICNRLCDEVGVRCLASTSGTACFEDGLECTRDECDGAGACVHPPIPGCVTRTPTVTRTPVNTRTPTRTPTPEPVLDLLTVRRLRLKANTSPGAGASNGTALVRGYLDENPSSGGFEQEISTTGVSLRIDGGGGVQMTFAWPASSCAIAPSNLGSRISCEVADGGGLHKLTLRPTSTADVYRVRFVGKHLNVPGPRTSAPVRVVLRTSSFVRQDDIFQCTVSGRRSNVSLCSESGVDPTPTPAPPLGDRVFSVARPGSALLSSIVAGLDVSAEPWLPAALRIRAGVVDVDGVAPLELVDDVTVGLKIVDGETFCMRIFAFGSHGEIDCDGGTPFDSLITLESNGTGPSGALEINPGLGADAGPGAAHLFARWNAQLLAPGSSVENCQLLFYSPGRLEPFTTALSTGTILNPTQGGTVSVSAQGQNFDCATWTEENGAGSLLMPVLALDTFVGDVANMLVIADAPSTQPPQAPTPTPSVTP